MHITLDELLLSRDNRKKLQEELLRQFNDKTLICLTVVMPGNIKRNSHSLTIAKAAVKELENSFFNHIIYSQHRDLYTGYEYYLVTDIDKMESKKICCQIETEHPLGRLFDIDVINSNGIPIQREEVGYGKRKCLICDNEARYCMRNFTHSQEEIASEIDRIIDAYNHLQNKNTCIR